MVHDPNDDLSYKARQTNDSYIILSYLIIAGTILTLLTLCYYYL